jgi:hypothetical protein
MNRAPAMIPGFVRALNVRRIVIATGWSLPTCHPRAGRTIEEIENLK